mgnify:CR=1 FL=1
MGPGPGRTLVAIFEGQQYPVTKEEFVIGRGQKTSDLTIRDSNVSRRHACVVLYNGQYWIVDQQSTNGVEFNGAKVDILDTVKDKSGRHLHKVAKDTPVAAGAASLLWSINPALSPDQLQQ